MEQDLHKQLANTEFDQVKLEIARLKTRLERLERMVQTISKASFEPQPLYLRQNI